MNSSPLTLSSNMASATLLHNFKIDLVDLLVFSSMYLQNDNAMKRIRMSEIICRINSVKNLIKILLPIYPAAPARSIFMKTSYVLLIKTNNISNHFR